MANTLGSNNPFPSVLFAEHVDPANPGAGTQRLFVDTDHLLKLRDSSGTVTTFGASGAGTLATIEEVDGSPTDSAVTKLVFPNGTLAIVGHVATYTPAAGGSAPDEYEVFLTAADVTCVNANTAYDVLSLTLGAGDWDIDFEATTSSATGTTHTVAQIYDGAAVVADASEYTGGGAGGGGHLHVTARVTLAGSTAVKGRLVSLRGSSDTKAIKTALANGTTNKATSMRARKITSV